MIDSVRNRAALVFPVAEDGQLNDPVLQTFDNLTVGHRMSDMEPLMAVTVRPGRFRKRHRPKAPIVVDTVGRRRRKDQGGQVIRPSVLRGMEELRQRVEEQFPSVE